MNLKLTLERLRDTLVNRHGYLPPADSPPKEIDPAVNTVEPLQLLIRWVEAHPEVLTELTRYHWTWGDPPLPEVGVVYQNLNNNLFYVCQSVEPCQGADGGFVVVYQERGRDHLDRSNVMHFLANWVRVRGPE